MKEVYLYRCELCGVVIAELSNRGSKFYIDECSACKHWADFEKVNISVKTLDDENEIHVFVVMEEKDDSKEKGKVD